MRVLLDTQIFIVLCQGIEMLGSRARKLVEDEENDLLLSVVSVAEIAVKGSNHKLAMTAADVLKGVEDLRLRVIPFDSHHAMRMFALPLHHRDPFDRMLIATALSEEIPIISQDSEFRGYRGLKVIA